MYRLRLGSGSGSGGEHWKTWVSVRDLGSTTLLLSTAG
jgi:hypothetical protein